MTNEEAQIIISKHITAFMTFCIANNFDNAMPRYLAASRSPELADAIAEYEEAKATVQNHDAEQLTADVAEYADILAEISKADRDGDRPMKWNINENAEALAASRAARGK